MIIQHNMIAQFSNLELSKTNRSLFKSTKKLSSGYKINQAADDAARLAISEKMRGQIRGLEQAEINAEDAVSMVQTAEGALQEIENMVHRMRELCVQSANDTNTGDDRDAIQQEINQLSDEISRIADDTEYNTRKILRGTQMETRTAKGTLEQLRNIFGSCKLTASFETEYPVTIAIPRGYKEDTMPDWVLGVDPLYPKTETTTTGFVTDKLDIKEIGVSMKSYTDSNGTIHNYSGVVSNDLSNLKQYPTKLEYVNEVIDNTDPNNPVVLIPAKMRVTYTDYSYDVANDKLTAGGTTVYEYERAEYISKMGSYISSYSAGSMWNTAQAGGSIELNYGITHKTHNYGGIDFSNLSKDNIKDLIDVNGERGFTSTCKTCDKHISFAFVNTGTGPSYERQSGSHALYNIDISSLISSAEAGNNVTGEDLVKLILQQVEATGHSRNYNLKSCDTNYGNGGTIEAIQLDMVGHYHYQLLLQDPDNPNKLDIVDNRNTYTAELEKGSRGQLKFGVYQGDDMVTTYRKVLNTVTLDQPIIDPTNIYTMTYTAPVQGNLRIQVGANGGQEMLLDMPDISLEKMGIEELDVMSHEAAATSIDRCDSAIDYINGERSRMGAYQNRLGHVTMVDANSSENLQAAESGLRDVDMAEEMTKHSKNNILMQAGQSMLAQANQLTQSVLSLLS